MALNCELCYRLENDMKQQKEVYRLQGATILVFNQLLIKLTLMD